MLGKVLNPSISVTYVRLWVHIWMLLSNRNHMVLFSWDGNKAVKPQLGKTSGFAFGFPQLAQCQRLWRFRRLSSVCQQKKKTVWEGHATQHNFFDVPECKTNPSRWKPLFLVHYHIWPLCKEHTSGCKQTFLDTGVDVLPWEGFCVRFYVRVCLCVRTGSGRETRRTRTLCVYSTKDKSCTTASTGTDSASCPSQTARSLTPSGRLSQLHSHCFPFATSSLRSVCIWILFFLPELDCTTGLC